MNQNTITCEPREANVAIERDTGWLRTVEFLDQQTITGYVVSKHARAISAEVQRLLNSGETANDLPVTDSADFSVDRNKPRGIAGPYNGTWLLDFEFPNIFSPHRHRLEPSRFPNRWRAIQDHRIARLFFLAFRFGHNLHVDCFL